MPGGVNEPTPEYPLVEVDVFKADSVESRASQKCILLILSVLGSEPDDRHRREKNIIGRIELEIVDLGA